MILECALCTDALHHLANILTNEYSFARMLAIEALGYILAWTDTTQRRHQMQISVYTMQIIEFDILT